MPFPTLSAAQVRQRLLTREETALIDLREEDPYAQEHPLWAANLPLSHIELQAWSRIPRRDTTLVLYGTHEGDDLAPRAAARFAELGYTDVHLLADGLAGWYAAGYEVFRDVNVPSKAFGEWVEALRHTPSLPAQEVKALLDANADAVVLDVRRFDEYQTMSIPRGISVPGAELVLRVRDLAPSPATRVIVNCAGRTRSIIGTQSLVNAGIPNPVAALRNGTIGWTLAGQTLDHGATRRASPVSPAALAAAQADARRVAERAGVRFIDSNALTTLANEAARTLYRFDVRTPEEYEAGHLPGFTSAPGGQLVQETDHHAPVRGARLVLDDGGDGVRAAMTASWLAQMGWEAHALEGVPPAQRSATGAWATPHAPVPNSPAAAPATPAELHRWLNDPAEAARTQVINLAPGVDHVRGHVPGAWFAIRAQLTQALRRIPPAQRYVLTCSTGLAARFAAPEAQALAPAASVVVLDGGTGAWAAAGLPLEPGEARLATPRTDRYRRPYEGTDAPHAAMQAYLDWEFGLVEQLRRDGTHHFQVVAKS